MAVTILHLLIIFLTPLISYRLVRVLKSNLLSPVVICYATGIALRNLTSFPVDEDLTQSIYEGSIVLAIPLLLFSANLIQSIKYARRGLLSFFLFVVFGIFGLFVSAIIFATKIPDIWVIGGMISGIFTGGTPNGNAIGIALGASKDINLMVNGADTLIGAPLLLFLTSIAPVFYGFFLPPFKKTHEDEKDLALPEDKIVFPDTLLGIGLAILILGMSVGLTYLLFGSLKNDTFIILLLTTFSIAATFLPKVREWKGTFLSGEYLLLAFCVALGLSADLVEIIQSGLNVVGYYTLTLIITAVLHLLFSTLFRIDRDTFLISFVAALYGPVFIGQIASTLNNRKLILMGMALSILGLAIGNYVGLGVAYALEQLYGK